MVTSATVISIILGKLIGINIDGWMGLTVHNYEPSNIIKDIEPKASIHDFRVVHGGSTTNLIFNLVVPHSYNEKEDIQPYVIHPLFINIAPEIIFLGLVKS